MKNLHEALKNRLGLGTGPLGNMYREVTDEAAQATLAHAWDLGIRYFDTAPLYGAGLAEFRLGNALAGKDRDDFALSTKVGRYVLDESEEKRGLFQDGRANKLVADFSEDATLRSIEQSLERLQTDRIDFVYVHDISPDFFGDEWVDKFDQARDGAFRVLTRLRDQGVISSWGIGVNTTEPIERLMRLEDVDPGICLSATQYTLLQHERALERMMPRAAEKGLTFVVGGPYNSGALLGGPFFDYAEAPPEITTRAARLADIAESHGVSLKAAALKFTTAHPAVTAVIPGSTRADRIQEDLEAMQESIPAEFWRELLSAELVSPSAPLPSR